MNCPYCGIETQFLSSKDFYGKDYGSNLYLCRPCDAYVGTHGNSDKALGTLANYNLRKLRKEAHSLFDPMWRERKMSRTNAYAWLRRNMNVPANEAHIGMFNEGQCLGLIEKLNAYKRIRR